MTKVRALTLKNTLLSGDVAVTIGGKVRNLYLLPCRPRDAPSYFCLLTPGVRHKRTAALDLSTPLPRRASLLSFVVPCSLWAPGSICVDARPPVCHAGTSGQVGRVRDQQQGPRVRVEHVRLHRRGRLPRMGEGSEAGTSRPERALAIFSPSVATGVERF